MQLAQNIKDIFGTVTPPQEISKLTAQGGDAGLSSVLSSIIQLIMSVGIIIFVFMIIISALQWITSGGDKDAVANARKRLTWAIIGVVILALAFVIISVIGRITGFKFFVGQP